MGYDNDDSMVRVDFFTTGIATQTGKPYMKWKYTEAIKWLTWNGSERLNGGPHMLIHDAFLEALEEAKCNHSYFPTIKQCQEEQAKDGRARGFSKLVCPEQLVN